MPAPDPPTDAASDHVPGGATVRRPRPLYRVFVSSTWADLQPERRALMEALNRMEEMRFVGMEFFGNRPDDTHDASIDQVDGCELLVGIIGFRYGSGITEAEYRRARALGLPCFVYFKREDQRGPGLTDDDPALAGKLAAFRDDLRRSHTVKEFGSPEELAASATADLHNWVAARWISVEPTAAARPRRPVEDADRTNVLRLVDRIDQDWIKGVLEASLHHRAWLELGLDWREDAVEHPWDRIVVARDRPIQTLAKEDSIADVFDAAQQTLLVLGEPGAGKTTTALELARDLIARARASAAQPAPVVLALSTWRGQHKDFAGWLAAELGLRYQVPKRVASAWLEEGRLVLILDGLDEVVAERRAACVDAINAFVQAHPPAGLVVTCRVAEYNALTTKLRLRSAICLQPLTPAQIERYFAAAGAGLEPLRLALRDDAGLRELARSPLMLSVMTMAWRDAPAGTMAPFAVAQTPEELRRRLFDAYVQAALHRRGKATGAYPPEQTMRWLGWLAQRMKEHGYTLFALEQLQPAWLDGAWRQFGYFLGSRLLGTLGLALPSLLFRQVEGQQNAALAVPALGVVAGCYLGVIDFAFARHGWGGFRRGPLRLWATLLGLIFLGFAWMALCPDDSVVGTGALYLFMVGLAFCAPVDVRSLDIKPAGSIQWSKQLALLRGVACLGVCAIGLLLIRLIAVQSAVNDHGWAEGWIMFGGWPYLGGLVLGGCLAAARWPWLRPPGLADSRLLSATYLLLAGQFFALMDSLVNGSEEARIWNGMSFLILFPVALFYVFGGFGSTQIDPARPQQAGPWFWLRVPVLAFFTVGGVIFLPGLFFVAVAWLGDTMRTGLVLAATVTLFSAGCGLVAFFRFGGFNGAQHFLLRWLLARDGHLPARAEAFLRHAAQLALLQKVGLGYRFIHALLLQHLAAPPGGPGEPAGAADAAATGEKVAHRPWRGSQVLRIVAGVGLGAGLLLLAALGAAGVALNRMPDSNQLSAALAPFIGGLMLSLALAIPILLMTGRWLGSRSWRWLGAGWLGLGLVLAYMVNDEPLAPRPPGLAEAPADFPGAQESNAVFTRYNLSWYGQPRVFRWTGWNFNLDPEFRKGWQDLLANHRAEVESNWQKLEPVRAWLAELNAFDRLADLPQSQNGMRITDYQVMRPLVQNSMAHASFQALDGHGDAALATLRPLLEVGGKLEEGARGTHYLNDARQMQDAAIKAASFVLDTTPVSPEARARFAAALSAHGGGAAGARRLYAIRYARVEQSASSFGRAVTIWDWQQFDFLKPELDLLGPVVFNRQASLNRWAELFAAQAEFAARRQGEQARQRTDDFLAQEGRAGLKNIGNAWVVRLATRELGLREVSKEQTNYWAVEDRRTALLARLRAP